MYLLIVQAGGEAGAVQIAVLATRGGFIFLAVRAALPPLFVFLLGPAPVRPVCALCGTACLSVWLAG